MITQDKTIEQLKNKIIVRVGYLPNPITLGKKYPMLKKHRINSLGFWQAYYDIVTRFR